MEQIAADRGHHYSMSASGYATPTLNTSMAEVLYHGKGNVLEFWNKTEEFIDAGKVQPP